MSTIPNAKQRFWDVVIIDMLINNNDRNEDNWGVIKNKKDNSYRLSPIYDCGNCFYGKTSEERIAEIMLDETKLKSSALNGITAYEDDDEKRIRNEDILKIKNSDLKESMFRVCNLVRAKLDAIKGLVKEIPTNFMDVDIMSDIRKKYYIETFLLRLECLLNKCKE